MLATDGKADVKDRQQESRVDGVYPASEVDTILAPNLTEATSSLTHRVTCFGWLSKNGGCPNK
jgi:hypothetical protein